MKARELRKKNSLELMKELKEARKKLCELRFRAALKQIKNHRELWLLKRDIARILTVLRERELLNQLEQEETSKKTAIPKSTLTKK